MKGPTLCSPFPSSKHTRAALAVMKGIWKIFVFQVQKKARALLLKFFWWSRTSNYTFRTLFTWHNLSAYFLSEAFHFHSVLTRLRPHFKNIYSDIWIDIPGQSNVALRWVLKSLEVTAPNSRFVLKKLQSYDKLSKITYFPSKQCTKLLKSKKCAHFQVPWFLGSAVRISCFLPPQGVLREEEQYFKASPTEGF